MWKYVTNFRFQVKLIIKAGTNMVCLLALDMAFSMELSVCIAFESPKTLSWEMMQLGGIETVVVDINIMGLVIKIRFLTSHVMYTVKLSIIRL